VALSRGEKSPASRNPGRVNETPDEQRGSVAQAIAKYLQGGATVSGDLVFGLLGQLVAKTRAALRKAPPLPLSASNERRVDLVARRRREQKMERGAS
jgi:hypothetical protein